jgi:hypothetical protein
MAGITSAVIGAASTVYSVKQAKKQQKEAQRFAEEQMGAMDPFAEHRGTYADRLNALASDPSSIENTSLYRARLKAAERVMAAQGYTGSGNALAAAADAGGSVYQQELENLMALSGAVQGLGARASAYGTAAGAAGNANDNYLGALSGLGNSIVGLGGMFGGGSGTNNAAVSNIKPTVFSKVPVKGTDVSTFNTAVKRMG